jgi:hypothetical protein
MVEETTRVVKQFLSIVKCWESSDTAHPKLEGAMMPILNYHDRLLSSCHYKLGMCLGS